MTSRRCVAAAWFLAIVAQPVVGQGTKAPSVAPPLPPVQNAAPPAPGDTALPPYEPQLDRLSELLGALTYLRALCGKGDAPDWRDRMSALLDAEATTPIRRDRLAGAFNTGLRGYEATYRRCTPSAELATSRFLDEGDRLTRELSTRFGGG